MPIVRLAITIRRRRRRHQSVRTTRETPQKATRIIKQAGSAIPYLASAPT